MLTNGIKKKIDNCRDILVGKLPDPKSQIEQITIALIYKFMNDIDNESIELGGSASFFKGEFGKYKWSNIIDVKLNGFERLNLYAEAIERMGENNKIPQLFRDIFKNAFLPYRDPETFTLFAKEINEFNYEHSEELGNAFEYLLSIMSSQGDAGQFRTPRNIIDFMVNVIQPQKTESILDPACGTAGFLISSYKYIKEHSKDITPDEHKRLTRNIIGYDISPDMVRLSLVNLYLHLFPDPKIYEYDTLTSENRWKDTFDIIMANPPFMTPKGGIKPHNKFAIKVNRSEVLFVDYIMEHLNLNGRAAVIVPEGIIFQSANAYKTLRKKLVEDNYLWAVVSLPAGVFNPYSGVKTSILFMDRNIAKQTDKILFVKIENDGFGLGAQRREIEKNDLPDALNILTDYINNIQSKSEDKGDKEDKYNKGLKPLVSKTNLTKPSGVEEMTASTSTSPSETRGLDPLFLSLPLQLPNTLLVTKKQLSENGEYNLTGERYRITERKGHQKWPMVKLGEVCEFISKGTTPTTFDFKFENKGINFIKIESIEDNGNFVPEKFAYINNKCYEQFKRSQLEENDVLFSIAGAFGRVAVVIKQILPANTNQALSIIRSNQNLLYSYYLSNILRSKRIAEEINILKVGVAQYNISLTQVNNLKIPLPPLEVQREIVAEIEGYQKIIDGARQVVDNWKPQIDIDPEWPMVKLGDVIKLTSTSTV